MCVQAFPGSAFTACALDVRVGRLDMCIGNFWVTAQRLALVDFVQPFSGTCISRSICMLSVYVGIFTCTYTYMHASIRIYINRHTNIHTN